MNAQDFRIRTKTFALRVIRACEVLSESRVSRVIGHQLLRSGTSVGANYRAACRAKSRADFISKMGIVEEECDESIYWMELLVESGQINATRLAGLMTEANELLALVVASIKTAKAPRKSEIRNLQSAIRNS